MLGVVARVIMFAVVLVGTVVGMGGTAAFAEPSNQDTCLVMASPEKWQCPEGMKSKNEGSADDPFWTCCLE